VSRDLNELIVIANAGQLLRIDEDVRGV